MTRKQIKTLLVENNKRDAFLLRKKLVKTEEVQFNLTHAERLETAVSFLHQESFDIVLLDLSLPDSKGLETLLTLEKIAPNLPIVLLTGFKDEIIALKAVRQGAQDYLVKEQTTTDVLVRSINYAIERMHYLEKISQSEERLQKVNQQLERQVKNFTFQLEHQNKELKKLFLLATTDRVTGIANRYRLEDFLEREWGNAIRNQIDISIIMVDIDYFKSYNDTYGHLEGDRCLKKVAQTIDMTIKRSKDLVARYGGEEFIVILPNVELAGATRVAKNIQAEINVLNIPHINSLISDRLTVSLGVASTIPTINSAASALITAADQALYRAKKQGRDRIKISQK
ncbi:diguanylate cyclase [Xenococcus sp. PCC 7305]|uniref:GGDEF domain-containing response regulator n=1 Tax=Xenococcus sp. PCC 7305 TaxID=102125 RepID=UPI000594C460|nr:diguanylate cyclase [Xenococcus sp. PCC 7305]